MICSGVFVRIKDKNLHVECFKCATCGTSLKNVGYYNINNKLYCDIHAKMVARQNPPAPNLEPVTISPWVHPDTTVSPPLMIKQCILLYVVHNYDVFTHSGSLKSWLVMQTLFQISNVIVILSSFLILICSATNFLCVLIEDCLIGRLYCFTCLISEPPGWILIRFGVAYLLYTAAMSRML